MVGVEKEHAAPVRLSWGGRPFGLPQLPAQPNDLFELGIPFERTGNIVDPGPDLFSGCQSVLEDLGGEVVERPSFSSGELLETP